jgi:CIC family chloride channel protein
MFKKYLSKLEAIIAWGSVHINRKAIYIPSVLLGITAAFAVIVLKTFARSLFLCYLHQRYFKTQFHQ